MNLPHLLQNMLWLIVAVCSYLILAVVLLVDKHLLVSSIPSPKVFAFYVGVLGILSLWIYVCL